MAAQIAILVLAIVGIVFTIWILRRNAHEAYRKRMSEIEEKVKALGGEIVVIEMVDRNGCPYSAEYNDPDTKYKFYRVRYSVNDRRKLGYGILCMKQNWYGPGLAADSKWIWRF